MQYGNTQNIGHKNMQTHTSEDSLQSNINSLINDIPKTSPIVSVIIPAKNEENRGRLPRT